MDKSFGTMFQKILATKGDGVIFLPDLAAKELVNDNKLIKIGTLKNVFVEYFFTYSKRIIGNTALDLLLKRNLQRMDFG